MFRYQDAGRADTDGQIQVREEMTTAIMQPSNGTFLSPAIISNIVLKGDIGGLNPTEKVQYYNSVCERLGLDPAMQPFQLLNLQGKQILYATKSAAEQLTKRYGISHAINDRQTIGDVHIVYVRATETATGRYEDSSGAVTIANLKGDALCNALMKAETKAKRRSTLSLLGLGMLDETEVETIPNAQPAQLPVEVKAEEVPPEPTREEVRKIADEDLGGQRLSYEDETLPFGKSKGKRFKDIPADSLKGAADWIQKNNVEKYYDLREKILSYLNDTGLPF